MLICQRSVAVAVVAVIVDDIAARRVGKTLPSGNVGNQDLCSSSSFILTKWIMNSSWMQAKRLTHLLHAFVVGVLLEMFAQRTLRNMIALDIVFVVDLRRLSSLQSHSLFA